MTRRDDLATVSIDESTNLALWLDRFAGELTQDALRVQHGTIDRVRVPEGYALAFEARKRAIARSRGGFAGGVTRTFVLELTGRAVVGIGVASVRETGLSLLRPWGVPVIPGSALKGLAARVAHASADPRWKRPAEAGGKAGELHQLVFGDVDGAGAVTFHDAWWIPGPRIAVHCDTMTVHHGDYYKGNGPPSDTDEPTPVSFLSSSGRYHVALSGPADAVEVAAAILNRGLAEWGIGAKTAAGYGRAKLEVEEIPPEPPSAEERIRATYAHVLEASVEAQSKWLLESAREPIAGVDDDQRLALIRADLAAAIQWLRAGDAPDDVVGLEAELEAKKASKPKDKKSKDFKRWQKDVDKLEKRIDGQRRAAANRDVRRAKVEELLAWLDREPSS